MRKKLTVVKIHQLFYNNNRASSASVCAFCTKGWTTNPSQPSHLSDASKHTRNRDLHSLSFPMLNLILHDVDYLSVVHAFPTRAAHDVHFSNRVYSESIGPWQNTWIKIWCSRSHKGATEFKTDLYQTLKIWFCSLPAVGNWIFLFSNLWKNFEFQISTLCAVWNLKISSGHGNCGLLSTAHDCQALMTSL